jgi:hypothetical protein
MYSAVDYRLMNWLLTPDTRLRTSDYFLLFLCGNKAKTAPLIAG